MLLVLTLFYLRNLSSQEIFNITRLGQPAGSKSLMIFSSILRCRRGHYRYGTDSDFYNNILEKSIPQQRQEYRELPLQSLWSTL